MACREVWEITQGKKKNIDVEGLCLTMQLEFYSQGDRVSPK